MHSLICVFIAHIGISRLFYNPFQIYLVLGGPQHQTQTNLAYLQNRERERSGSVVESWTQDQRAAGSSLTGVTALWSLSKTHLS